MTQEQHRGRPRGRRRGVEGRDPADRRVVREVRRRPAGRPLDRARRPQGAPRRLSHARTARGANSGPSGSSIPAGRAVVVVEGSPPVMTAEVVWAVSYGPEERARLRDGRHRALRGASSRRPASPSTDAAHRRRRRRRRAVRPAPRDRPGRPRQGHGSLGAGRSRRSCSPAWSSPLGQQGAELLAESAQWAKAFQGLAHDLAPLARGACAGPFAELRGDAIAPSSPRVVADAVRGAAHRAAADRPRHRSSSPTPIERDVGALRARRHDAHALPALRPAQLATHKYVAAVTAEGAQVRTLDEFFNRLIVVDRRIAIVPGRGGPGIGGARRTRTVAGGLPRRHLRAVLGAGPALHQPRHLAGARRSRPSSGR